MVTRTHKTLIWERTRAGQRLRHALREYFPAALEAFEDLDAADTLELLAKAPDPASAARLTTAQISAALKRARRRDCRGEDRDDPGGAACRASRATRRDSPRPTPCRSVRWSRFWAPSTNRSRSCKGRSRPILVGTRTLKSSCPSPVWERFSAPGCSQSSAMTTTATSRRKPARTTPGPARSPARPGRRESSPPGSCTTTGSSTHS